MYEIEDLKVILNQHGYEICEHTKPVANCKERLIFKDKENYILVGTLDNMRNRSCKFRRYHKNNPYSIANLNLEASRKGLTSVCIEDKYDSCLRMSFCCECGNTFKTTCNNFLTGHKTKCDECMGYHRNYTYERIKQDLHEHGYELLVTKEEYKGITLTPLLCTDNEGYKCNVYYSKIMNGQRADIAHKFNPYTLENIQKFVDIHCMPFILTSTEYEDNMTPLKFKCKRCGNEILTSWRSINRYLPNGDKGRICCPNCDGTIESLHAIALKQMFVHEYPDTIPEERSCINPNTNCAMPTDIVNHRLKIAIEIQSQWHDSRPERDKIKRDYWVGRNYKFYAPDIRDYTILEMLQLFFDVDKIPDYIDFSYANKLNFKLIQGMLDDLMSPREISDKLNVHIHRIYDAIGQGNLHYNENYIKGKRIKCYK